MRNFYRFLALSTALALTACGGSSSSSSSVLPSRNDVVNVADVDTSLSCREHEIAVSGRPTMSRFDLISYPVYSDNLETFLSSGSATWPSFGLLDASYSSSIGNFIFSTCNYEMYAENRCTLIGSPQNVSVNNGVLSFDSVNNGVLEMEATVNDVLFNEGTVIIHQGEGITETIQWTRDLDGTERFNKVYSGGASLEFTENPDCSGNASFIWVEGADRSADVSWNSPNDANFKIDYTYCTNQDGPSECVSSP